MLQSEIGNKTMQTFKINSRLEAVCEWKKTRIAFKHEATLLRDGTEVGSPVKICYLNRTWERYTYESVLEKLLEKTSPLLSENERRAFKKTIAEGGKHDAAQLKSVGVVMKLGEIFNAGNPKAINDWKARMLKAGLGGKGLIMPEDWDELDEETKQARLDGAIKFLTERDGKGEEK